MPNLSRAWGESSLLPFGCKLVCLQLGQIRGASTAIHHHLLHSHPLRPRPDQIQNPNSKRAVWVLDFGVWILDFGFWGLEFGFWILDFGFWILDFGFWILDFGSWILDFGFWILDFGFWILDLGFWILDQFSLRSFCGGPKRRRLDFGFWSLEFGFWSLEFGFWSLEFGVWSLDFGFWSLDFGFWSLDFGFWILVWMRPYLTSFGSCIRYFHVTPTRVGGFPWVQQICLFPQWGLQPTSGRPHQALGNCWLMASIAAVASRPELIQNLFDTKHLSEDGISSCKTDESCGYEMERVQCFRILDTSIHDRYGYRFDCVRPCWWFFLFGGCKGLQIAILPSWSHGF